MANRVYAVCYSILALPSLMAAQAALAQDSFLIDAGPCLALTTPVERLACFENQVRTAESLQGVAPAVVTRPAPVPPAGAPMPQAASRSEGAATPAMPPAPAAADSAAGFGLRERAPVEEKPAELLATIASVREFAPGQLMITLTNGQVWRQNRPERYGLAEGHEVRIYATRWGNAFRLSAKALGGFIQVERVE